MPRGRSNSQNENSVPRTLKDRYIAVHGAALEAVKENNKIRNIQDLESKKSIFFKIADFPGSASLSSSRDKRWRIEKWLKLKPRYEAVDNYTTEELGAYIKSLGEISEEIEGMNRALKLAKDKRNNGFKIAPQPAPDPKVPAVKNVEAALSDDGGDELLGSKSGAAAEVQSQPSAPSPAPADKKPAKLEDASTHAPQARMVEVDAEEDGSNAEEAGKKANRSKELEVAALSGDDEEKEAVEEAAIPAPPALPDLGTAKPEDALELIRRAKEANRAKELEVAALSGHDEEKEAVEEAAIPAPPALPDLGTAKPEDALELIRRAKEANRSKELEVAALSGDDEEEEVVEEELAVEEVVEDLESGEDDADATSPVVSPVASTPEEEVEEVAAGAVELMAQILNAPAQAFDADEVEIVPKLQEQNLEVLSSIVTDFSSSTKASPVVSVSLSDAEEEAAEEEVAALSGRDEVVEEVTEDPESGEDDADATSPVVSPVASTPEEEVDEVVEEEVAALSGDDEEEEVVEEEVAALSGDDEEEEVVEEELAVEEVTEDPESGEDDADATSPVVLTPVSLNEEDAVVPSGKDNKPASFATITPDASSEDDEVVESEEPATAYASEITAKLAPAQVVVAKVGNVKFTTKKMKICFAPAGEGARDDAPAGFVYGTRWHDYFPKTDFSKPQTLTVNGEVISRNLSPNKNKNPNFRPKVEDVLRLVKQLVSKGKGNCAVKKCDADDTLSLDMNFGEDVTITLPEENSMIFPEMVHYENDAGVEVPLVGDLA